MVEARKSVMEKLKAIQASQADEPVEKHDPSKFAFINKKAQAQDVLQDGVYNYSKPLHFDGLDYLSVYDTNLDIYNTASKVDTMASGLAMLCLYKLGC